MTKRELGLLWWLFFIWRGGLFVIGSVADQFLRYAPSFPYARELLPAYDFPRWIYSWANFDGVHYLTIAEKGYLGTGLIQAFFPVFPLVMKVVNLVVHNALLSGLLIANVSAFALVCIWYLFLKELYKEKVAWLGVFILLLFPTSFFLGALYSESLFLFLVIACFWAARHRQWWLAALIAAIASATRIVGVMLVPALLVELYIQRTWEGSRRIKIVGLPKRVDGAAVVSLVKNALSQVDRFLARSWKEGLLISVGVLGLLLYMTYLSAEFQDPLYFLHVQSEFGSGRQENFITFPQVIWRYLKILWYYRPINLKYFAFVQEFVLTLGVLAGLLFSLRKVRFSYVLFALTAFLVPTLTGTFSSMPRYVLVCFPVMIWLAQFLQTKRWATYAYLAGSGILLILNTLLFIQGYWVA